jgi:hypothetical protein
VPVDTTQYSPSYLSLDKSILPSLFIKEEIVYPLK